MPVPAAPDNPDDSLLERHRAGDRDALPALLKRHERRLFNICLRMLGHRDDAADACQDAMLKVWQSIDGFRGDAKFSSWATRIAMNQSISLLRRRKVRQAQSLDTLGGDADAATDARRAANRRELTDHREPPPDHRVQLHEEHRLVLRALGELDTEYRQVLVLRDIEGMDYQTIAQTLELPTGTVKSRLFRARLLLRQIVLRLQGTADTAQPAPPTTSTSTSTSSATPQT